MQQYRLQADPRKQQIKPTASWAVVAREQPAGLGMVVPFVWHLCVVSNICSAVSNLGFPVTTEVWTYWSKSQRGRKFG